MSLIDTARIATLLSVSHRHATEVITKKPGFPAPKMNVSQRMRRWDEDEVRTWAGLPAQVNRAAISEAVVR